MDQKKLVKQLGLASRMKVRDYYGTIIDPRHFPKISIAVNDYIEAEDGDFVFIISLHDPDCGSGRDKRREECIAKAIEKINKGRKK